VIKADRVLDNPPYNLVIHSSPVQEATSDHYHWHIEFMPKLTKTAGFEWGTGFYINPTPPEEAARFLREASVEEPIGVGAGRRPPGPRIFCVRADHDQSGRLKTRASPRSR